MQFRKILVANRGEIAVRIFRACRELGIETVAVYAKQEADAYFTKKADYAVQLDEKENPVQCYLDMENIIRIAKENKVDAVHPGYGFLAENTDFARMLRREHIAFIGPSAETMEVIGDKISAKEIAKITEVPVIPGSGSAVKDYEEAREFAESVGYPVILKAAFGGGGRGMRVIDSEEKLEKGFKRAVSEARKAFGDGTLFVEKYLKNPKHIEVQILGDRYGNIVHLFERDCSVQRRHQKVVEIAPAVGITQEQRMAVCRDAIKIARQAGYINAGTVEFLLDEGGSHYFIEVNPRIQVEHTVTEVVTGIDIVKAQIYIAQGCALTGQEIGIYGQESVSVRGCAIQCRVTTEDPALHFIPDIGSLTEYHAGGGLGVRFDEGCCRGSEVTPFFDSLLVKVIAWGRDLKEACKRADRALVEIQIDGVKTNKEYLRKVIACPRFQDGSCNTGFIEENPQLIETPGEESER